MIRIDKRDLSTEAFCNGCGTCLNDFPGMIYRGHTRRLVFCESCAKRSGMGIESSKKKKKGNWQDYDFYK